MALNACFNHLLLDAAVVVTHPGGVTLMQTPEHAAAACGALFADTPNGEMR